MVDVDLILRIINVLDKPVTRYILSKKLNKSFSSIYQIVKKMEELHIVLRYNNIIRLSGGNVFKLTDNGTFLVFFGDRIPVVINCPFWNICPLKKEYDICFGEGGCRLLKKILS